MPKLNQIQQELQAIDQARFQKLCDAYCITKSRFRGPLLGRDEFLALIRRNPSTRPVGEFEHWMVSGLRMGS